MNSQLLEIASQIFNTPADQLNAESSPMTVEAWDSLAQVSLIAAVEEAFAVKFSMRDIMSIKTLKDINDRLPG